MKKVRSSQTAIFILNLVKHSFSLWVSLNWPYLSNQAFFSTWPISHDKNLISWERKELLRGYEKYFSSMEKITQFFWETESPTLRMFEIEKKYGLKAKFNSTNQIVWTILFGKIWVSFSLCISSKTLISLISLISLIRWQTTTNCLTGF